MVQQYIIQHLPIKLINNTSNLIRKVIKYWEPIQLQVADPIYTITRVFDNVEKLQPSYIAGGDYKMVQLLWKMI
jgi:hypothetical protein